MRSVLASLLFCTVVAGCGVFQTGMPGQAELPAAPSDEPRPVARPATPEQQAAPVPANARTVEEFDTTTAEERSAAVARPAAGSETDLGVTIASLGAPSEPGFWLKTPLVSEPAKGRVVYADTGKSVAVDLIPIDGPVTGGSRMSLSAMRLIEAPLTGLPELRVFRVSD